MVKRTPVTIERKPTYRAVPEDYTNIGQQFEFIANPTEEKAIEIVNRDSTFVPFIDYKNQKGLEDFLKTVCHSNLPVYLRTTAPIELRYIELISNQFSTVDIELTEIPDRDLYDTITACYDKGLNVLIKIFMDTMSEADILELLTHVDHTITRAVLITTNTESEKYKGILRKVKLMKTSICSSVLLWEYGLNFIGLTYRTYLNCNGLFFAEKGEWK